MEVSARFSLSAGVTNCFAGKNVITPNDSMRVAGQRIEARDRVDLVAEKFQPDRFFIRGRRIDLDHVAADAEFAARQSSCRSARRACRRAGRARLRG